MAKSLITLVLLCASLSARVTGSATATADDEGNPGASSAQSVNPVIEWNWTLLLIVRTPGAQPPTIHSTRSFAAADFTQWPQVTPFALARADEFRPGPPPELTSDEYTSVFDEVKSLGFIHSTRCDEVAKGILDVEKVVGLKKPLIVRMVGTNEEEGRRLLETAGIIPLIHMEDAARLAAKGA